MEWQLSLVSPLQGTGISLPVTPGSTSTTRAQTVHQ